MSKYVETECNRCGEIGYVSVTEVIETKNHTGIPSGWKYRDLGDIGPEPFELCNKCWQEYREKEENFFRQFIKSMVTPKK